MSICTSLSKITSFCEIHQTLAWKILQRYACGNAWVLKILLSILNYIFSKWSTSHTLFRGKSALTMTHFLIVIGLSHKWLSVIRNTVEILMSNQIILVDRDFIKKIRSSIGTWLETRTQIIQAASLCQQ